MTDKETPVMAFILSLLAGILILISGIMFLAMGAAFMSGMMGAFYGGMMGGYQGVIGYISSMMTIFGIGGIICGIIILIGAYMINSNPASHATWGAAILVFSFVSLFEGGGFFLGAILGIIGGILAITWKPADAAAEPKTSG